jgi:hypothetical protein
MRGAPSVLPEVGSEVSLPRFHPSTAYFCYVTTRTTTRVTWGCLLFYPDTYACCQAQTVVVLNRTL